MNDTISGIYVRTTSLTCSHVNNVYCESGVPIISWSLELQTERKSGHVSGHESRGTLTSQKGRGSGSDIAASIRVTCACIERLVCIGILEEVQIVDCGGDTRPRVKDRDGSGKA
jgi:hypothetical protein